MTTDVPTCLKKGVKFTLGIHAPDVIARLVFFFLKKGGASEMAHWIKALAMQSEGCEFKSSGLI